MGQRSLGNRSIIADPRNAENIHKINHSIKMGKQLSRQKAIVH